jgi:hypothetical protein
MWFRFAGLSIEELFPDSTARRNDLFASCRKIQSGPSECFLPSNLLTEQLILAHFNDPPAFNWKTVDVRSPDCDRQIRNPKFHDDDPVSKEQRDFQWERRSNAIFRESADLPIGSSGSQATQCDLFEWGDIVSPPTP